MAKFLVTGGAGFIGSNLVDALVAQGDQVRVLDNFSSGKHENLEASRSKIEVIEGDISDRSVAARAMEGIDYVHHHAALASVPKSVHDPWWNHEVNVNGTLALLLAARDAKVKRFVLASSSAIYGESEVTPKLESMETACLSPYATSKLIGEDYCRQFTECGWLDTVCLRYFNIYGPRQDPAGDYAAVIPIFVQRLLDGQPVTIYGDGEQTRDFTYIDNVVHANLQAASKKEAIGGVFNIGCGISFTVNDLYHKIASLLGSSQKPNYAPPRDGDVKVSLASIERAQACLGYSPKVGFDVGLDRTTEWFQRHQGVADGAARS